MVFEVTLGNVIALLVSVVAALWALFKLVSVQQERRINERFDTLTTAMEHVASSQKSNADATAQLEREFLRHQVELARDYVRRDDFVQVIGTINTRFDNFALRIEAAVLNRSGGKQP
jgi:hypothetical protein